jgi:hypothetical protein
MGTASIAPDLQALDHPSTPDGGASTRTWARGSSAQSPADVLHEKDEVEVVGRAGLELGHEMQVEVSSRFGLGVNKQTPASDVIGQFDESR